MCDCRSVIKVDIEQKYAYADWEYSTIYILNPSTAARQSEGTFVSSVLNVLIYLILYMTEQAVTDIFGRDSVANTDNQINTEKTMAYLKYSRCHTITLTENWSL